MAFTSVFIAVLIISLVTVSFSPTLSKRIVRKLNGDDASQPSQRILELVAAMSPTEPATPSPTSTVVPISVTPKKSDVRPTRHPVKERTSA